MLPNTLNTNEVKDRAGVEVEFQRLSTEARKLVFSKVGETPSLPYRLTFSHLETGSQQKLRRRSLVRVDKTLISPVDTVTPVTISAYVVLDTPVGHLVDQTAMADVIANLNSVLSTTGAGTTVLFDGTGTAAASLLSGSL